MIIDWFRPKIRNGVHFFVANRASRNNRCNIRLIWHPTNPIPSTFKSFSFRASLVGRTQRKTGTPHRRTLQRRQEERKRIQHLALPEILRPPQMGRKRAHRPSLHPDRLRAPIQSRDDKRVSECMQNIANTQAKHAYRQPQYRRPVGLVRNRLHPTLVSHRR